MPSSDSSTRLAIAGTTTLVMMLLVFLVAPEIAVWQRGRLAKQLADQVIASNDAAVKVPLRQLAQLSHAGLEPLVVAAASDRAKVSTIARQIIDEKMAAWELLAMASTSQTVDLDFIASVNTLAANLAVHIDKYGPAGKQWVERLALDMIDLADILPARQSAVLLADCSEIFASVPPRGPTVRTVASVGEAATSRAPSTLVTPQLRLDPLTRASDSSLEILARRQPRTALEFQGQLVQEQPRDIAASARPPQPAASDLDWVPQQQDTNLGHPHPTLSGTTLTRIQTAPEERPETSGNRVVHVPTPKEMQNETLLLRQVSTDALLVRLGRASFFEAGIVRKVLIERGFTDADLVFMQRLAAPEVEIRLRLIEDVSMLPATMARRLLGWLLEDESAEVRLRALTALATTNSSDLGELARELALHDEDPRVSELASRLLQPVR